MTRKNIIIEVIGVYAMVVILAAYGLSSFGFVPVDNMWNQLMNLTGGAGFVYYAFCKKAWASLGLNIVWFLIAAVALVRIFAN